MPIETPGAFAAFFRAAVCGALATAALAVGAQTTSQSGRTPAPAGSAEITALQLAHRANEAHVRFQTVGRSDKRWPIADAAVSAPAFLTVVAITPSRDGFAAQILYPLTPGESAPLAKDQFARIRPFEPAYISHRVASGGAYRPIIIGVMSSARPDLTALARADRWAEDAFIRTPMDSTTDLAQVFVSMAFPDGAPPESIALYDDGPPVRFGTREDCSSTPPATVAVAVADAGRPGAQVRGVLPPSGLDNSCQTQADTRAAQRQIEGDRRRDGEMREMFRRDSVAKAKPRPPGGRE